MTNGDGYRYLTVASFNSWGYENGVRDLTAIQESYVGIVIGRFMSRANEMLVAGVL